MLNETSVRGLRAGFEREARSHADRAKGALQSSAWMDWNIEIAKVHALDLVLEDYDVIMSARQRIPFPDPDEKEPASTC